MNRIANRLAVGAIGIGVIFGGIQTAWAGAIDFLRIDDFITLDIQGFDSSSIYSGLVDGSYGVTDNPAGAGVAAMDVLGGPARSPIANGSEDTWGASKISGVSDSAFNTIWTPLHSNSQLGIFFYGSSDFHMVQTLGGAAQTISSAGLMAAIYELALVPSIDFSSGIAGRTALDEYTTVTTGAPVLVLESIPGHLDFTGSGFGGDATTFKSDFNALDFSGTSQAYFRVKLGAGDPEWELAFDQNIFGPTIPTPQFTPGVDEAADVHLTANVFPNLLDIGGGTVPTDAWTVQLTDPARAFAATVIPTPSSWIGLAGFGLMGLVRRKKRA